MSRVLNLLLTHQVPEAVARMLDWWRDCCPARDVLVAFNGTEEAFARISHPNKIRVVDPRLVTVQHSRERQSYTTIFRDASRWLAERDFTHVNFAEYDQVPLVSDLNARQVARLEEERADVLAFQLAAGGRHQSTPLSLPPRTYPASSAYWESFQRARTTRGVVLSMFGSGSVLDAGGLRSHGRRRSEPFPIYLELFLPTTAHHLGYRLRDWGGQNRHITSLGDYVDAHRAGWSATAPGPLHPVKTLWDRPLPGSKRKKKKGRPRGRPYGETKPSALGHAPFAGHLVVDPGGRSFPCPHAVEMDGSQPINCLMSVLSLLRPLTPLGALRL